MNISEFYNELKTELELNTDGFFMITPSDNKEDLDKQYQRFIAQNDDQKDKANTRSFALYGMNNYDHYQVLLSKITKGSKINNDTLSYNNHEEKVVKEEYSLFDQIKKFKCKNANELDDKINTAIEFNAHTLGRIIIYPTKDANELESLYMRYMMLDTDNKISSDNKTYELFGMTNREIYLYIKDNIIKPTQNDDNEYQSKGYECIEVDNTNKPSLFTNDLPVLTPGEMVNKVEENYSCFNDSDANTIREWRESYALLGNGIKEPDYNKKNLARINILRKAIYENNNEAIIQCGWIPTVEFNSENRVKASEIVRNKMNKTSNDVINYDSVIKEYHIDPLLESRNINDTKAVSIILVSGNSILGNIIKKVQRNEFSHASISLDDNLNRIYSFNRRNGFNGLSYESIKQYAKDGVDKIGVYTFLVSNEIYKQLEKTLDNFNLFINKTKYSILNLLTIPLNIPLDMDMKMVCSEFVDKLLKSANIDITNKKSMFVSPKDFSNKVVNNAKIIEIFNGNPKDLNPFNIEKKIKKIKMSNFPVYEFVEYDNEVITEAKSFPIQFDSDGNLIIKNLKKIDFEQEYTNSHRLLMEYEKAKSYEPMKFELAKMQFLITLLEKKIYKQGKDKSINELKVRARFLNDFKKYLKIITADDKSFNFTEYYDKSKFNDALIQIDKNTLKFGWKALKYIIKENTEEDKNIGIEETAVVTSDKIKNLKIYIRNAHEASRASTTDFEKHSASFKVLDGNKVLVDVFVPLKLPVKPSDIQISGKLPKYADSYIRNFAIKNSGNLRALWKTPRDSKNYEDIIKRIRRKNPEYDIRVNK